MKLICISGTPGTGKTTLAKFLARKLDYKRIDLHDHYKEISTGYNRSKQCYDIDMKKLEKLVKEKRKKDNLIVDSHIAHLLSKRLVDLCIVLTRPDLEKLEKRLKKRKYSKKKVDENLQAEIFQVCLMEAKKKKHDILIVDVSKGYDKEIVLREIERL